tara:strand:+ start:21 stop:530 length:510 start_codon:yes stop_codon:yes gene_type:complete
MKLLLAFLASDSELLESHILNKAAAWVSGEKNPMIHVEAVFVDSESAGDVIGRSCSIHYGGKVFLDQKRFSRKQWRFRSVGLSDAAVRKAFAFCEAHVGEEFNKVGFFMQPVVGSRRMSKDTWFCSEIVAGALRAAGMDVEESLHPHKLYTSLCDVTTPDCPRVTSLVF